MYRLLVMDFTVMVQTFTCQLWNAFWCSLK